MISSAEYPNSVNSPFMRAVTMNATLAVGGDVEYDAVVVCVTALLLPAVVNVRVDEPSNKDDDDDDDVGTDCHKKVLLLLLTGMMRCFKYGTTP